MTLWPRRRVARLRQAAHRSSRTTAALQRSNTAPHPAPLLTLQGGAALLALLLLLAAPALVGGQTAGSACVTGSTWCSIAYTTGTTVTGTTPKMLGVNLGHKHPTDSTWLAYMRYLGANGACRVPGAAFRALHVWVVGWLGSC